MIYDDVLMNIKHRSINLYQMNQKILRGFGKIDAPVAQLDRVPGYELGGRRFESFRARQLLVKMGTNDKRLSLVAP